MFRTKNIIILVLLIVVCAVAWAAASDITVDQKGVLAGRVVADGLVSPGTNVHEGDILVYVETLTGPAPTVRANTDGKVVEVLVKPGSVVNPGDILVKIEPARK